MRVLFLTWVVSSSAIAGPYEFKPSRDLMTKQDLIKFVLSGALFEVCGIRLGSAVEEGTLSLPCAFGLGTVGTCAFVRWGAPPVYILFKSYWFIYRNNFNRKHLTLDSIFKVRLLSDSEKQRFFSLNDSVQLVFDKFIADEFRSGEIDALEDLKAFSELGERELAILLQICLITEDEDGRRFLEAELSHEADFQSLSAKCLQKGDCDFEDREVYYARLSAVRGALAAYRRRGNIWVLASERLRELDIDVEIGDDGQVDDIVDDASEIIEEIDHEVNRGLLTAAFQKAKHRRLAGGVPPFVTRRELVERSKRLLLHK